MEELVLAVLTNVALLVIEALVTRLIRAVIRPAPPAATV